MSSLISPLRPGSSRHRPQTILRAEAEGEAACARRCKTWMEVMAVAVGRSKMHNSRIMIYVTNSVNESIISSTEKNRQALVKDLGSASMNRLMEEMGQELMFGKGTNKL